VGPAGHRALDGAEWPAARILAQAFGEAVALLPSEDASELSTTAKVGKTAIVARWRGGVPIELRIGDARP
jgi:hypothetical protein